MFRMIMSSRLWLPVFFGLVFMGCEERKVEPHGVQSDKRAVAVHVMSFGERTQNPSLEFSGTLQSFRSTPIAFSVNGTVMNVSVENGDTVKAGQLLAVLDSSSLWDVYQVSVAKLMQAEDAYHRMKPLRDSGAVPEVKWVEMETGLSQAKSMASLSRKNWMDTKLRAPVRGVVVNKKLEVGQNVLPGMTVMELLDARYLDAVFAVGEMEVLHVRLGMPMTIRMSGGSEMQAHITEVAVEPNPISRTYAVRVRLDNQGGRLRLGMACHGTLVFNDNAKAEAVLPVRAVLEKSDGSRYVYVVRDGVAYAKKVKLGGFLGKGLRVLEGLEPKDLVVVEGVHGLTEGLRVSY